MPTFCESDFDGINTDLYELTMAGVYFASGVKDTVATFELFTRRLPATRRYYLAAGLEQSIEFIQRVHFSGQAIDYLRGLDIFAGFDSSFFEYLRSFRFTGDVWALPEGTAFFADEPILQVRAPIIEAQILETALINIINFQSMIASKASRIVTAAGDRAVVDFGSRRAHGIQSAVLAARAAYIGGVQGTSNVRAGREHGVPVFGTMAHSMIQFFESELDAFKAFQQHFPEHTTLLVDTYDTIEGVKKATQLEQVPQGIRLDSGDLLELARKSRKILDEAGLTEAKIVASGGLEEEKLERFRLKRAPIDSYGVGTDLVVSADAPTCDLVYKLVEIWDNDTVKPRVKESEGKATLPFRKQVFRVKEGDVCTEDWILRENEAPPQDREASPLIEEVIRQGELAVKLPSLDSIRERARKAVRSLPSALRDLHSVESYPVHVSPALAEE